MKTTFTHVATRLRHAGLLLAAALTISACGNGSNKDNAEATDAADDATATTETLEASETPEGVPTREYTIDEDGFHHTYLVADQRDERHIYKNAVNRDACFFVISKKDYRLYVYEQQGQDTLLVATFPVCYAIKPEAKQGEGDNKTPECGMDNPFHISEINDASGWPFDFGDGRGSVLAFGDYFMRLDLTQSFPDNPALAHNRSIGIHGSTNNASSVPGRDSHGCVRMLDEDLVTLHDKYAQVGTMVVIKPITQGKLPFELAARDRLGDRYVAPTPGNPLLQ